MHKKKILMRSGETDRSIIVNDKKILNFCEKIKKYFPFYGNMDCDLIRDKNGKIYLIDLNPRFGEAIQQHMKLVSSIYIIF